jgi:hypothetical protein
MSRSCCFALLCLGLSFARGLDARAANTPKAFDLYQVSVNAKDCKITFHLNGERVDFLSGDGSHGMSASVPLSALDLTKENKIKLLVEALQAEPSVTVNVRGVDLDEDAIVDTREPGDVLTLVLDAQKIRSAKKKEFTAKFTANLRGRYQPFTEEQPVIDYAIRLLGLFQKRDHEALAAELLPVARKAAKPGAADDEVKAVASRELKSLLDGAVFKPVDPKKIGIACQGSLICRPFVGDEPMLQVRPKGNAPDDFDPIRIGIAKVGGKLQVVRFMERD